MVDIHNTITIFRNVVNVGQICVTSFEDYRFGSSGQICVTSFKDYLFRKFISVNVPPVEPHVAVVLDGQAAQQMTTDGVDSASETKADIVKPSAMRSLSGQVNIHLTPL